jgi:ribosomal protein L34E
MSGFWLHTGVACKSNQRKRLEHPGGVPLYRYITRPAIRLEIEKCENCGDKMKIITPYPSPVADSCTMGKKVECRDS